MIYPLKNGGHVTIRKPVIEDAASIITIISTADSETKFLARNPGEFHPTLEKEKSYIEAGMNSTDNAWFVAEYEGKVVGQCSVGLVRSYQRYRHRAEVAFVLLEDYCSLGIGGKMMEECLKWCRDNNILQAELEVVTTNERALHMYQNFGFEITGTIPKALQYTDGTFADEYFMVKQL